MIEEWGPWIEHDGWSCPLPVGTVVEAYGERAGCSFQQVGVIQQHNHEHPPPGSGLYNPWLWQFLSDADKPRNIKVLRYRIRRPRGMEVLDRCLAQLPPDPPQGDQPAPRPAEPVLAEGVEA